jgi:hypothetical protein
MVEWFVRITGENFDLEKLSKSLNSPELCVIQEGPDFSLKSADFNSLKDADDVRNRAIEILSLINGAARLALGMRKPLAVDCVVKVNDDGAPQFFVRCSSGISLRVSASMSVVAADGTVRDQEESPQADPIPNWIVIAQRDTNVAKVLRLFGAGNHGWVSLYRIYEVIVNDVGNIAEKGWATKNEIIRFKQTANSPDAIGDDARHGKEIPPPPNPMLSSEAKSFVETIIYKWLHSK